MKRIITVNEKPTRKPKKKIAKKIVKSRTVKKAPIVTRRRVSAKKKLDFSFEPPRNLKLYKSIIIIILALSVFIFGVIFVKKFHDIREEFKRSHPNNVSIKSGNTPQNNAPISATICKKRSFNGDVIVGAWYEKVNDAWIMHISENDIAKLPGYDGTDKYKNDNIRVRLVDVTPQLEQKLKAASEKKPVKVNLKGYGMPCDGVPLASLETGIGIFDKI